MLHWQHSTISQPTLRPKSPKASSWTICNTLRQRYYKNTSTIPLLHSSIRSASLFQLKPPSRNNYSRPLHCHPFIYINMKNPLESSSIITTISRPDLAFATMSLFRYMSCPNLQSFHALHHTMCYLFLPSPSPYYVPSKPTKSGGTALSTSWAKGHAEYLTSDYGDGLVTLSDADHARCLRSRCSVSVYFILYNGITISWSCKKQL
jgi:hypothetical protein